MNTCPHRSVSLVELRNLSPIPFRLSLDPTISNSLSSLDYRLYRKSHLIISPIPFKLSFQRSTDPKPLSPEEITSPISDEPGSLPAPPYRLSLGGSLPRLEIESRKHQLISLSPANLPEEQKTDSSGNPRTITSAVRHPPISLAASPPRGSKRKATDHQLPPLHGPTDTDETAPSGRKRKRRRQNRRRRGPKEPSPAISDDSIDRQVMTAATAEEMDAAAEMWVQKTMRKLGYPELLNAGESSCP
jgi:hypothetical protein